MEFGWSEAQLELAHEARAFAERELNESLDAPVQGPGEDDGASGVPVFNRRQWERCAAFGVQGAYLPEAFGGRAHDILTTVALLEAIGQGCRDNGFLLGLNGHMWAVTEPILRFGSPEQHETYLRGLASGAMIGAYGMTEPDSGSDAFSLSTTARRVEGGYVLDGRKVHVGLAPACDVALVFASTNPEHRDWGITAFIVEARSEGFEAGPPEAKMGLDGTPLGAIDLRECFVPEANRLGPEGAGASIFNHSMEWERSFIFASHVGAMQRQLDEAVAYAKRRRQFGQPIGSYQSVSNRIVDMKLRLETARLLLYRSAWLKQTGARSPMEAALTKLHISESFVQSSFDAVRTHGALGYLREHGVERDLRDATGGVIYSGTSDIQRQLIAKLLGL